MKLEIEFYESTRRVMTVEADSVDEARCMFVDGLLDDEMDGAVEVDNGPTSLIGITVVSS